MAVAKTLTEQDWIVIQTRYESGDVMRTIAEDYDIALGTVQNKAKKLGWERNKIVTQLTDIKENFKSISQSVSHDQLLLVNDQLQQDLKHITEMAGAINSLHKGALKLHGLILTNTLEQTQSGAITSSEAARIAATQGLSVDKIAGMAGLSKDKSTVNIQNNQQQTNESQGDKVIINIKGYE